MLNFINIYVYMRIHYFISVGYNLPYCDIYTKKDFADWKISANLEYYITLKSIKMTYYFQIKAENVAWENIKAQRCECKTYAAAVKHAKQLSKMHGVEIRMSDNSTLTQGKYFKEMVL